jgi:thymidine kinase
MSLELIIGPMFAGKSSAILQRVRRANIIQQNICIVTSSLDNRCDKNSIQTHDSEKIPANSLKNLNDILLFGEYHRAQLVIIEEAQFFPDLYTNVVKMVEVHKKDVIVVGLDGDSDRNPFGEILRLIPLADTITKLTALCKRCSLEGKGVPGLFSALIGKKDGQICVGGNDKYEALCRRHFLMKY